MSDSLLILQRKEDGGKIIDSLTFLQDRELYNKLREEEQVFVRK